MKTIRLWVCGKLLSLKSQVRFSLALLILLVMSLGAQAQSQAQKTLELAREYARRADWPKAAASYKEISKEGALVQAVYPGYTQALLELKDYEEAERYVRRLYRATRQPAYLARVGIILQQAGKGKEADKAAKEALAQCRTPSDAMGLAKFYEVEGKPAQALESLLAARRLSGEPLTFAYDIAMLYRKLGQSDKMLDELFALAEQDASTLVEVQGMLQQALEKKEDVALFEQQLMRKVQQNPQSDTYAGLLYWLYLQQQDFEGAFSQAKALDARLGGPGAYPGRLMETAQLARNAQAYGPAADVYAYVARQYHQSPAAFAARRAEIEMRQEQLETSYPPNLALAHRLVADYSRLAAEAQPQEQAVLLHQIGRLQGFWLGKPDSANAVFEQALTRARYSPDLAARIKLDWADLYLLRGEPWESTLLYSQVEKDYKEQPIGHEAKLRNARLSFYKGEFVLSQEHLDVLKQATSREISNDALQMSLMISDNLVFDTTGEALKPYARADLALLRRNPDLALRTLDSILIKFKNHTLEDDVLWRKAQIYRQYRRLPEAVAELKLLEERYPTGILADDALFAHAQITEQLGDKPAAMQLYEKLLTQHPGSVYVAEARKRFRVLRGDAVN